MVTPGTLTVNVRRGDYYGTVHEAEFGIRIVPYVAAALALQAARAPLGHVQVVSDDLPWCQANLAPTLDGQDRGAAASSSQQDQDTGRTRTMGPVANQWTRGSGSPRRIPSHMRASSSSEACAPWRQCPP